jgi:FtsZ-interacting cell division protein YlmF
MAAFMEKLRTLVGIEDDYDEYEEYEEPVIEQPKRKESGYGLTGTDAGREKIWDREPSARGSRSQRERENEQPVRYAHADNVVPMPRGNEALKALTQRFKIVVIDPRSFDDCPKLVDSLKARKPVIINLEKIETDAARKIFDFLSGATYALSGNVQKISNNIFVFLPENVDVSTNTEHKGITFGTNDDNPWKL